MNELVEWQRYIRSLVMRRVGRRSDKEDILQEVLLYMASQYRRFDPSKGAFPPWALVRVRSELTKCIRRRRTQARTTWSLPLDEINDDRINRGQHPIEPIEEYNPENLLEIKEKKARLDVAIKCLSPRQEMVVRGILSGKRNEDIAPLLGISTSNVGTTLGHAREQLRRLLATE